MEQLDLFGHAPHDDRPRVRPMQPPAHPIAELGDALPRGLRLGTSSWSFPGWMGLLYDPASDRRALSREGLRAYAQHPLLRAVGVDSAYHAPIPIERLRAYADQVPADFRFVVKTPAIVTDPFIRAERGQRAATNDGFLDPQLATELAVKPYLEALGTRGGALLLQFPPVGRAIAGSPRRFAEGLYRFLRRLPSDARYAVEVRDSELLTADFVEALRHGGASPVYSLHPRLPTLARQAALFASLPPSALIVRWMLRQNRGYEEARGLYQPFNQIVEPDLEARHAIARLVSTALSEGREAFVIANNKAEGCAPLSLAALAGMLVEGRLGA